MMRSVRSGVCLALTLGMSFLAACSGTRSLPSTSTGSTSSSSAETVSIPRLAHSHVVIPATSPSTEQLFVLNQTCYSGGNDGNCSTGGASTYNEVVARWQLSTGSQLSPIALSGGGGAQVMAVSADDRYILWYDELNGVAVTSTSGSTSTIVPSSVAVRALEPSTNLLSDLIVENPGSTYDVYGYREPYTSSYGHVSIPSGTNYDGFAAAANLDGSQVFIAQRNGVSTEVSVGNLSTGAVQKTDFPEYKGEIPTCGFGLGLSAANCSTFDARHQWFYFLSSTDGTPGKINRVQLFATNTYSYLGYLNLPAAQAWGLTLNVNNSDLYVQVGQRIYVYNVGSCGCAAVRRSFSIPGYAGTNPTLDRSGTHLFTQGRDPANPYTTIVYDFNPQTGALQHTFTVANSTASNPDFIVQTAGQ